MVRSGTTSTTILSRPTRGRELRHRRFDDQRLTVENNTVSSSTDVGLYLDLPYFVPNLVLIEGNTVSGSTDDGIFEFGPAVVTGITLSNNAIGLDRGRRLRMPGRGDGQHRDWEHDLRSRNRQHRRYGVPGQYRIRKRHLHLQRRELNADDDQEQSSPEQYVDRDRELWNGVDPSTTPSFRPTAPRSRIFIPARSIIENNIVQMTGGTVFNVPAADQAGFASNYNLFDLLHSKRSPRPWRTGPD